MITTDNPYIGKIAHTINEMKEISENSRKYERTGEDICWVNVETKEVIDTNL